jgi:hypothetical protein
MFNTPTNRVSSASPRAQLLHAAHERERLGDWNSLRVGAMQSRDGSVVSVASKFHRFRNHQTLLRKSGHQL